MGAFAEFQKAVFRRLAGDPAVVALVGTKVYDDVPHQKEGTAPEFPFVTIGDQTGAESGASDLDASAVTIAVHAWSRKPGRLECLQLLDAIRDALHNRDHAVAGGAIVRLDYQGHETLKDQDGETYHGICRFEGLYQYG